VGLPKHFKCSQKEEQHNIKWSVRLICFGLFQNIIFILLQAFESYELVLRPGDFLKFWSVNWGIFLPSFLKATNSIHFCTVTHCFSRIDCMSWFCHVRCVPESTYFVGPGTKFLSEIVILTLSLSSQVTFVYIALFTIQFVSKQLHSDNMKIMQHRSIILLNIKCPTPNPNPSHKLFLNSEWNDR